MSSVLKRTIIPKIRKTILKGFLCGTNLLLWKLVARKGWGASYVTCWLWRLNVDLAQFIILGAWLYLIAVLAAGFWACFWNACCYFVISGCSSLLTCISNQAFKWESKRYRNLLRKALLTVVKPGINLWQLVSVVCLMIAGLTVLFLLQEERRCLGSGMGCSDGCSLCFITASKPWTRWV